MKETKVKTEVVIIEGKYCRDFDEFCRFYWESEDGDYGCSLLRETAEFIEGDFNQVPKLKNCPNSYKE